MALSLNKKIIYFTILPSLSIAADSPDFTVIQGDEAPDQIDNYNAFVSLAGTVLSLESRPDSDVNAYLNRFLETENIDYSRINQLFEDFMSYRDEVKTEEYQKVCKAAIGNENFTSQDFFRGMDASDVTTKQKATMYMEENLRVLLGDRGYSIFMNHIEEEIKPTITIRQSPTDRSVMRNINKEFLISTYCSDNHQ